MHIKKIIIKEKKFYFKNIIINEFDVLFKCLNK